MYKRHTNSSDAHVLFQSLQKFKLWFRVLRYSVLAILFVGVVIARLTDRIGEWYAGYVYPVVSFVLSYLSSIIPVSCEEILAVLLFVALVIYVIRAFRVRQNWRKVLLVVCETCLWVYVWFYWGWGLNYFRADFYERAKVSPSAYNKSQFETFLDCYTVCLNESYQSVCKLGIIGDDSMAVSSMAVKLPDEIGKKQWRAQIREAFADIPMEYGLCRPSDFQYPKKLIFNSLYSGVGVLGYMGPFFCEMQLNADLPAIQYSFTYAHELSHMLGVSSEAEANYWAFRTCISCTDPMIRYSGFYGLLPYVVSNAHALLDSTGFHTWFSTLSPEILWQWQAQSGYWQSRYIPFIGYMQELFYDWFLKGNNIPSGKKNYNEVISLILSDGTYFMKKQ